MTEGALTTLPETCGVAFKEWSGVCEALAVGAQSIILRKGGIEEGPRGFSPEHEAFWLYPTRVHEEQQGLKPEGEALAHRCVAARPGTIGLNVLAIVSMVAHVDLPEVLSTLDPFHVWTPDTVEKRFFYRRPGLWVLGVRVYSCTERHEVPVAVDHAGCKTWVPLGMELTTAGSAPVLGESEFRERMEQIASAINSRTHRRHI